MKGLESQIRALNEEVNKLKTESITANSKIK